MQQDLSIDHLIQHLRPLLQDALTLGTELAGDVAAEVASKATGGLAGAFLTGARSIALTAHRKLRQSKARKNFEASWEKAQSESEREAAIRSLLLEDPELADSLEMLLLRRNFVRAVAEYCEDHPFLDSGLRLSDIYVPLDLAAIDIREATKGHVSLKMTETTPSILEAGNHLIEGGPGAGKSIYLHQIALTVARQLLGDLSNVAFDQQRLPVLVEAKNFATNVDFATALHRTASVTLGWNELGPRPDQFFLPTVAHGHQRWLVLIDGLDEVRSQRARQKLWNAISSCHAQLGDAFRFIVASRPDAIRRSNDSTFLSWTVRPLDAAAQQALAERYIFDPEKRRSFLERVEQTEFKEVANIPLFVTMAAQLFEERGVIHSRKFDLCDEYADYLIDKAFSDRADDQKIIRRLLSHIAMGADTAFSLVADHSETVESFLGKRGRLSLEAELERVLAATGLVRQEASRFRFSHDLFRSYFAAIKLSEVHLPSADTWSAIVPFDTGWLTVEYLFTLWARAGHDINPALRALLAFGEKGLRSAVEVNVAYPDASDAIVRDVAARIIQEGLDRGWTIFATEALTRLAAKYASVRKMLEDLIYCEDPLPSSDIFAAECLTEAGCAESPEGDGLHLEWIASSKDAFGPDRVQAAELMLKYGYQKYKDDALAAFRDIAVNGDELWSRLDAAVQLYAADKTKENRGLVVQLLALETRKTSEHIFASTLAQLLQLGETELALPHLLAATELSSERRGFFELHNAIEAAKVIAVHHEHDQGKHILEKLLLNAASLREKAEIVTSLADIGFETEARHHLDTMVDDDSIDLDWCTLDLLVRLGMADKAERAGMSTLQYFLECRARPYDVFELVEHLRPIADIGELAKLLLGRLSDVDDPRLARLLASLGRVDEARSLLTRYLDSSDLDLKIRAAGELCCIGESKIGLSKLSNVTRNRTIAPSLRLAAAETMKRVGMLRRAAIGFARIVRDGDVGIDHRCHAAIAFDELEHDRNDIVWHPLLNFLDDADNLISERIEAAETLIAISIDNDGYFDIPAERLRMMLDDGGLSDTEFLRVATSLAEHSWALLWPLGKVSEMSRIKKALCSDSIDREVKIEALEAFKRYTRSSDDEADLV